MNFQNHYNYYSTKTSEKTIIKKFVQQLLSEGQSIHNISKEYGLPYNLFYEAAHGIKHPRQFPISAEKIWLSKTSQTKESKVNYRSS